MLFEISAPQDVDPASEYSQPCHNLRCPLAILQRQKAPYIYKKML
jgi:hypothetical protein